MQNISSSASTSETTRIEVNVSEFHRGEVSVKLRRDNTLLVHALHLDQYAVDNFYRKELVKTFPLPAGADIDKIRSVIRSTGILSIDIPMLRDKDATRRSHEQLLQSIEQPSNTDYHRSNSAANMSNERPSSSTTTTLPKRADSLSNLQSNSSRFNIADFLQSSTFHPTISPNGKKLILKVDTRGYEPDELTVRLFDSDLLVQGRKKSLAPSKRDDFKQFTQNIRLPNGIDKYNVTSQVMDDGILVIDVPLLSSVVYYR